MKYLIKLFILGIVLSGTCSAKIKPTKLTCEYLKNPTVVDEAKRVATVAIDVAHADGQAAIREQNGYLVQRFRRQ